MKLTDDQMDRLLQIRGERQRHAEAIVEPPQREFTVIEGGKKDVGARSSPVERFNIQRWMPTFVAAAAAVVVSIVSVRLLMPEVPVVGGRGDWVTRSMDVDQTLKTLAQRQLGRPGWRRAGLVIGVSDYSGFRQPRLVDLPLASTDAARARRALETAARAARPHIISLLNDAATETGARAAVRWLRQFDRPGDLIVIHVAAHGYAGPDGRLHLVLADSRRPSEGSITGVPVEDLLKPLAGLASTTVLIADVCQSGTVKQMALGPRQCVVASAGASELAVDSIFGEAWFGELEGAADSNGDGMITLREAFEAARRRAGETQHPLLQEGRSGLADEVILNLHPQVAARLPEAGAVVAAPGMIEFVPDGPCQVWLDGDSLGLAARPVMLHAGPAPVLLRAVREGWTGPEAEWQDKAPVTPVSGQVAQRVAVFGPPSNLKQRASVRLTGAGVTSSPFPKMEGFGQPPARGQFTVEGALVVERPLGSGPCGLVLLANDAVGGVDMTALTGIRTGETVTLSISAKAEGGSAEVTFFAGGRANESLNPRIEKTTKLDDQWQSVALSLPAEKADRLVSGFGVSFAPGDGERKKILIRDITWSR